ncbi:MAG: transporter associated domain-containing protein, partial [Pseudomonadota bacterium]
VIEVSPGIYDVLGLMNLDEFVDFFDIDLEQIHGDGEHDAETLAGYMIQAIGDLPKVGQSIPMGPLTCEVSQVSRRRIERIRVRKIIESTPSSGIIF